jgi:hypothetical protein
MLGTVLGAVKTVKRSPHSHVDITGTLREV